MRPHRRSIPFLLTAVALVALPAAARAAPASDPGSAEAMAATVQAIRERGRQLLAWFAEHAPSAAAADGEDEPAAFDWSACPPVTPEQLVAMLGADATPGVDGWGRALEICANPEGPAAGHPWLGVRSAGGDGELGGPTYAVGAFDETVDRGADVVWMDGYFITWPAAPER